MANKDILLNQRAEVNLYRIAYQLIKERLLWDLHPRAWSAKKKLLSWQGRYEGQKAVILCNGPSLLKSDLSLLKGIYSFGLNKINLLFEKSDFRPSFIVAVNRLVIAQNAEFFNQTDIPIFLDSGACEIGIGDRSNVHLLHSTNYRRFARNCAYSVYQGYTVTFVAMQLAFHMGFQDVALIGCDHNFSTKGPANRTVASGEIDADHFDPKYFSGGDKWQLPDLVESEGAYVLARDVYETFGRRVFNATEGGRLEIFNRLSLEEFVAL